MKLNLSQIKAVSSGAVCITEEKDGFCFFRFTEEQKDIYKKRGEPYYKQTYCTSGIKLRFITDSKKIFIKINVSASSLREYFALDIFENGKMIDYIGNFSDFSATNDYISGQFSMGEFTKQVMLGEGKNEICIYLPWSVRAVIKEIAIDDGSFIEPVKYKNKLLCFGDSITQGYDALHPSNKYITSLADFLDAEEYNKAIGCETFFPELAAAKENFVPDYITVAYGTNDWSCCSQQEFDLKCRSFFENLSERYPDTYIFAITPIWRKDLGEYREFGEFNKVEQGIKKAVKDFKNIIVISGFDFIPQNENLFTDLRLHPNDEGFRYYYNSLCEKIFKER